MNVLLVDDDPTSLAYLSDLLRDRHRITACSDGGQAIDRLKPRSFDVVFTDLLMPGLDGFEVLKAARGLDPPVPVIVLTAMDHARPAVEALRLGARDFLVKPVDAADIARTIADTEKERPGAEVATDPDYGLVGSSPSIRLVRRLIPALARSRESVLVLGETGTGKELLARALHAASPRGGGPFVAHNMAATPGDLAEAMFFGHARGAFSGAISDHRGLFDQADGGTLFLDEVDSFPAPLQAKLLRVLEGGSVRRLGSASDHQIDVRVIAACAGDLSAQVDAGAFRADLYYRLRQLEVVLPPLRERPDDLEALVRHFLDEVAGETGRRPGIDGCAMERLAAYAWPGNVRELRNVLRAAAVLAGEDPIRIEHFPRALREGARAISAAGASLRVLELRHIRDVLESVAGNQSQAARILGIDRGTLARKLAAEKRDLTRPD